MRVKIMVKLIQKTKNSKVTKTIVDIKINSLRILSLMEGMMAQKATVCLIKKVRINSLQHLQIKN